MRIKVYGIILFICSCFCAVSAQNPLAIDTIPRPDLVVDTSFTGIDSTLEVGFTMSRDSLDAPVDYQAVDSMQVDASGKKIHLWGQAQVNYTTISLKADHIVIDYATNIATAEGRPDSSGQMGGFPEFNDGAQTFTAKRMRYNFDTRKGVVYDVTTQQNDVIVHGGRSKFISAVPGDSTSNDIIYSEDALFTTCTAEHPHYGIHSRRQKVIPNKLVIIGPSNLEIMDIPTPLFLPFGFFPISKGRSTGLLFPKDYEYSPQWGFGFENIGWFFPLGESFNLSLLADVYFKGTFGLRADASYRKRYRYSGNFLLGMDNRRQEDQEGNVNFQRSYNLRLSHQMDPAAHPENRFGGSINFQTNDYQRRVNNDARSVQDNLINSNFSFTKNWRNLPISMSLALRHSQNTRTRQVQVDFPNFQFQTQTLYPLRRKERIGPKRWYEDITLRYTNMARASFEGLDTSFFQQQTFDEAQIGVQQDVTTSTSFKVLKYFNLNPNANYRETWYLRSFDRFYDPDLRITYDTTDTGITADTIFGKIDSRVVNGFSSFRTYSAGVSINTQIYGTLRFNKGFLRGIRHQIKPSVSIAYTPNYLSDNLDYFEIYPDTLDPTRDLVFSRFQGGIFGAPPQQEAQLAINYSLNNIFEAKLFSRRDSTTKNIKLLENVYIRGSYLPTADSLKWTPISLTTNTRFFKGATSVAFSATFDPLLRTVDNLGRVTRVDRSVLSAKGKLVDFVNARLTVNTNLTIAKIRALFQGEEEEVVTTEREERLRDGDDFNGVFTEETDLLSLFENFSINHNYSLLFENDVIRGDTTRTIANSLDLRGSIRLTPNWNFDIGRIGYDFTRKAITYPYIGLTRDLHCWEMGFSWAPVRNTYSFYLRVKPGTLDFIKVPYQRNQADGARVFD